MANTINLGNGEWATKDGNLLAYNDENGNFKPIELDFTRASTGTNVNRLGLLESARTSEPRIDFSDNPNGSLLLEPQSTNLITYPRSFGNSYWTKSGATIEGDASTAGVEKVVNGNFPNSTNWTLGSGWTIGSNKASNNGTSSGIEQFNILEIGKMYKVTFDLSDYVGGTLFVPNAYFETQFSFTANGSYEVYVIPKSTRLYMFSSSFTGSIANLSFKEVQGFASPHVDYPTGAFNLTGTSANLYSNVTAGVEYTISFYVKSNGQGKDAFALRLGNNVSLLTATSEWVRYEFTATPTTSIAGLTTGSVPNNEFNILIFGAQLEQQASATSLILGASEGSTVTRIQDTASKSGMSSLINSTEGTLYFETKALSNDLTERRFSISDGTNSNVIRVGYTNISNRIIAVIYNGSNQAVLTHTTDITQNSKIAVKYKENDFALWVNGVERSADISGSVFAPNTLNSLDFNVGGVTSFYGNIKDVRVYNTALTDAELITLTTI